MINIASHEQKRFWVMDQLISANGIYNNLLAIEMNGILKLENLKTALSILITRHEVLRTQFKDINGELTQDILPTIELPLEIQYWLENEYNENSLPQFLAIERAYKFNLQCCPLIRFNLICIKDQKNILVINIHHIISDGLSMTILLNEMSIIYNSLAHNKLGLDKLDYTYRNYALWQKELCDSDELQQDLQEWCHKLKTLPLLLDLAQTKTHKTVSSYQGNIYRTILDNDLLAKIYNRIDEHGITLNVYLLTILQIIVHRYTGQDNILTGVPFMNRVEEGTQNLLGCFVNTLPIHTAFANDSSVNSILEQVNEEVLSTLDRQHIPFDRIVDALGVERDLTRHPIYQIVFVSNDINLDKFHFDGLELKEVNALVTTSKFDLTVTSKLAKTGLILEYEYSTELFDEAFIQQFSSHFEKLIRITLASDNIKISDIELVSLDEISSNNYTNNLNSKDLAITRFEEQARLNPNKVAIIDAIGSLNYSELNCRANSLAHNLIQRGINSSSFVGLCFERNASFVIAMLAVSKIGAAYVPLDPSNPKSRLEYIINNSKISILLTQTSLTDPQNGIEMLHNECIDIDKLHFNSAAQNLSVTPGINAISYIIYTSGSTGNPKGVMVTQKNLARLFTTTDSLFEYRTDDVWTCFHSFAFDFSVWEIWGALTHGAKLWIVPYDISRNIDIFYQLLDEHKVSILSQTPSAFSQLVTADRDKNKMLNSLRYIIFGGEAINLAIIAEWWSQPNREMTPALINMYGITETTVHTTFHKLTPKDITANSIYSNIGKPLPDLNLYLLDKYEKLVPPYVIGEIHIAGDGVTNGYLNQDSLTKERFITTKILNNSTLVYKSGDLGYYDDKNNIYYIGRSDFQVKLRGFRIELGEIENALLKHPYINNCCVILEHHGINEVLIAYYTTNVYDINQSGQLRSFMAQYIPNYMIPNYFIQVEKFALTSNGKIDKKALPKTDKSNFDVETKFVAPQTEAEKQMCEIWAQVLQVSPIGINDNFFALGGDSIQAIKVISLAKERGITVELIDLFTKQNINKLLNKNKSNIKSIEYADVAPFSLLNSEDYNKLPVGVIDAYPLSQLQAGMVFHSIYSPQSTMYCDIVVYKISGPYVAEKFSLAIANTVNSHPILRTSFHLSDFSEPVQCVHENLLKDVEVSDLRNYTKQEQESIQLNKINLEKSHKFNWEEGPLFKFSVTIIENNIFNLYLTTHHSILDGWSVASFITELLRCYDAKLTNMSYTSPVLQCNFNQFIALEKAIIQDAEHRAFWYNKLIDKPYTQLTDFYNKSQQETDGSKQVSLFKVAINQDISVKLLEFARTISIPIENILLAAYCRVINLICQQSELLIGIVSNGRLEKTDGDRTLGLFLNTIPLNIQFDNNLTWLDLVNNIFNERNESMPYRRFPLVEMQKLVNKRELIDIIFNYTKFHVFDSLKQNKLVNIINEEGYDETNFSLSLDCGLDSESNTIRAQFLYDNILFTELSISRINEYWQNALNEIINHPSRKINFTNLLPTAELQQIKAFSKTKTVTYKEQNIYQLIDEIIIKYPDNIALITENSSLSYRELSDQVNSFANYLSKQIGRRIEPIIAICCERNLDMIVAILAAQKMGIPYTPLDPKIAISRLKFIIKDINASIILGNLSQQSLFCHLEELETSICYFENISKGSEKPFSINIPSAQDAYIIYTSGSTGEPKGVVISQNNLVNHMLWMKAEFKLSTTDKVLFKTPFTFDASVWEIYLPLICGSSLVVAKHDGQKDPEYLIGAMDKNEISIVQFVPSLLEVLLPYVEENNYKLDKLRLICCGGEPLSINLVKRLNDIFNARICNLYGPTECTIDACWQDLAQINLTTASSIPIGEPITNMQAYVLDSNQQIVPFGVRGELCLAGSGVSNKGYLNRESLNQEKFIQNPYSKDFKYNILYRTGDIVKWNGAGQLEYLNRIDYQIKIRGNRIELGEIENQILKHPNIQMCKVIVFNKLQSPEKLIAYIKLNTVPKSDKQIISELEAYISNNLPDYMHITKFIILENIPLTANGKVDLNSLPEPIFDTVNYDNYEEPQTGIECLLAQIWCELLKIEQISLNDNFFQKGGDSIISIQAVTKSRKHGIYFTVRDLFESPTIKQLVKVVQVINGNIYPIQDLDTIEGNVPFTPIQKWFLNSNLIDQNYWNQAALFTANINLNTEILEKSIQDLIIIHDIFRLCLTKEGNGYRQTILSASQLKSFYIFQEFDIEYTTLEEKAKAIYTITENAQIGLELEKAKNVAIVLLNDRALDKQYIFIAIHHMVIDAVSWHILLDDLHTIYEQYAKSVKALYSAKTLSYLSWATHLQEIAKAKALPDNWKYWQEVANNVVAEIPVDFVKGPNDQKSIRKKVVSLSAEMTSLLIKATKNAKAANINDLLISAMVNIIAVWANSNKVSLSMESHGRKGINTEFDLSKTIGWFTSIYPVNFMYINSSISELVESVIAILAKVPDLGIGYGVLKYQDDLENKLICSKEPPIIFNYLGTWDNALGHKHLLSFNTEFATAPGFGKDNLRHALLEITGQIYEGKLQLEWLYSSNYHHDNTILELTTKYIESLRDIIQHFSQETYPRRCLTDFPLLNIDQISFDKVIQKYPNLVDIYPLSSSQLGLYFQALFSQVQDEYNLQNIYEINQALDITKLKDAWDILTNNNTILRTCFMNEGLDNPVQIILQQVPTPWSEIDLTVYGNEEQKVRISELISENRTLRFNLSESPLFKFCLLKLTEQKYILIWNIHHIIIDGWSTQLILQDWQRIYGCLFQGFSPDILLRRPYRDYIAKVSSIAANEQLNIWQEYLNGLENITEIRFEKYSLLNGITAKDSHQILSINLSSELADNLQQIARKHKVTLNAVFQASWSALLNYYTDNDDLVYGVVSSGRSLPLDDIEHMIGLFLQTLPIRVQINSSTSFAELMQQIQKSLLLINETAGLSLSDIKKVLPQEIVGSPFKHIFVFESYPNLIQENSEVLSLKVLPSIEKTEYPLVISVLPDKEIKIFACYKTNAFTNYQIEQLMSDWQKIISLLIENQDYIINNISLYQDSPADVKLVEKNDSNIAQYVSMAANKFLSRIAITYEDQQLTYEELEAKSNQLANYLLKLNIKSESLIAVCLERSLMLPVVLLGVLKSGCAYLPLDPNNPETRQTYILHDASPVVLITEVDLVTKFDNYKHKKLIIDEENPRWLNESTTNPRYKILPEHLAYVIYTSGSTGKPKGVLVEHQQVIRLFSAAKEFNFSEIDVWTCFHSFAFDFSVWEIWGALMHGAKLVMVPYLISRTPDKFFSLLKEQQVTILNQTPSAFKQILSYIVEDYNGAVALSLRKVIFGGEELQFNELLPWFKTKNPKPADLINMYGITETTVHVTYFLITPESIEKNAGYSIIGKPLADLHICVLDSKQRHMPPGMTGEMYVGGAGVTRGYLNQVQLNKERFIKDPAWSSCTGKYYRTGDLGIVLPNKDILYQGRIDHQIKLRGFRIELGEIAETIKIFAAVKDAVVLLQEKQKLVAYIITDIENWNDLVKNLMAYLEQQLPNYMLPQFYIQLEAIPLTVNGKLDIANFPKATADSILVTQDTEVLTEMEAQLKKIWCELLNLNTIGKNDNFFHVGGDSIISIQLVSRASRENIQITVNNIFDNPTITSLAAVAKLKSKSIIKDNDVQAIGEVALTPIQSWFFAQNFADINNYNQAFILEPKQKIITNLLKEALTHVLSSHSTFNLRFSKNNGIWKQYYSEQHISQTLIFETIDILNVTFYSIEIEKYVQQIQAKLDITSGPIFGAILFNIGSDKQRIFLVCHHLLIDSVSWRIVLEDLVDTYLNLSEKNEYSLKQKTLSYKAWTLEQQKYINGNDFADTVNYYNKPNFLNSNNFSCDYPEGTFTGESLSSLTKVLTNDDTSRLLNKANLAYHTQVNDLLLSALLITKFIYTQEASLNLSLEGHGRELLTDNCDLTNSIGWFTTIFPIYLFSDKPEDLAFTIKLVKEQLRQIPNRGIDFGLIKYLGKHDNKYLHIKNMLLPSLSFNYLGQWDNQKNNNSLLEFSDEQFGITGAKANNSPFNLVINSQVKNGVFSIEFNYSLQQYSSKTIESLANIYIDSLQEIIRHCCNIKHCSYTPSDFPLVTISQTTIDQYITAMGQVDNIYPLTPMQQGMLFHSIKNPDDPAYLIQFAFEMQGAISEDKVQLAWQKTMECYSILRTSFLWSGVEQAIQCVHTNLIIPFTLINLAEFDENQQKEHLQNSIKKDYQQNFDLKRAPLMRLTLFKLNPEKSVLLWTHHHILLDGWCVQKVLQSFFEHYRNLIKNYSSQITEVPYANYIKWLQRQDNDTGLSFWSNYLANFEPVQKFMLYDYKKENSLSYDFELINIDAQLTGLIKTLARNQGITLNIVLQAAWALLLSRYTQSDDIVYGVTVSGRAIDLPKADEIVGLFINTLPFRNNLSQELTVEDFLKAVHKNLAQIQQYSHISLAEIQKLTNVGSELFDHIFVFENFPKSTTTLEDIGVKLNQWPSELIKTEYSLTISAWEEDGIKLLMKYSTKKFHSWMLQQIGRHFTQILQSFINEPQTQLKKIAYMTTEESLSIYHNSVVKNTGHNYSLDISLKELFEEAVVKYGNNIVAIENEQLLTYSALNIKANQLAHYLVAMDLGVDSPIAICLASSINWLIATLAAIKIGKPFVPIDAQYPIARIENILSNSEAKVLISLAQVEQKFPKHITRINLDEESFSAYPVVNPVSNIYPETPIYIIYTSGSTGNPKGVVCHHRGVVNLLQWMTYTYPLFTEDRVLQNITPSFDPSIRQAFWPLLQGAQLIFVNSQVKMNMPIFIRNLSEYKITTLFIVPSVLNLLLENLELGVNSGLETLNNIFCVGEPLHYKLAERAKTLLNLHLYNQYGPTETTGNITSTQYNPKEVGVNNLLPIGKPLANTSIYILDDNNEILPIGIAGEIFIGGSGISHGYLKLEEISKKAFVDIEIAGHENKLYRTGDLGCYLPDGQLIHLGRRDQQIKLNGLRIEVEEISNTILRSPLVKEAAVIPINNNNLQIYAFVVLKDSIKNNSNDSLVRLKQHAAKYLPQYMLPSQWIIIDKIPRLLNNKINRTPLMDFIQQNQLQVGSKEFLAPVAGVEAELAMLWQELLKVEQVSRNDNFFDCGGHSLLAMRLMSRIYQKFTCEISINEIFQHSRLDQMSSLLLTKQQTSLATQMPLLSYPEQEKYPLSFAQQRMWFIDQMLNGSASYNVAVAIEIIGKLDLEKLRQATYKVVARHDILRTKIITLEGHGYQFIDKCQDFSIDFVDLSKQNNDQIMRHLETICRKPFKLANDFLLRVSIVKILENKYVLALNLHHIITDAWSMSILTKEISLIYNAIIQNEELNLPSVDIQYKDFTLWQHEYLNQNLLSRHLTYWTNQLKDIPEIITLPWDNNRPALQSFHGAVYCEVISEELSSKINAFAKENSSTLFMTLISAVYILLSQYSQQDDLVLGTPSASRNHHQLENMLGLFVNTLALRVKVDAKLSFNQILDIVKSTTLQAYEFQDVPFEQIVASLDAPRYLDRHPIFQVMFALQNSDSVVLDLDGTDTRFINLHSGNAKFDLAIIAKEDHEGISLIFEYATDLFFEETISRFSSNFISLLEQLIINPNLPVNLINYLSSTEKQNLIINFNDSKQIIDQHVTFIDLFEQQVKLYPDELAIITSKHKLSYIELNNQANKLAHGLILNYPDLSLAKDQLVGIYLPREVDAFIAMLAVLKIGAAYIPLDPTYPFERIHNIIEDANLSIVLCNQEIYRNNTLNKELRNKLKCIENLFALNDDNLSIHINSNDLAYIIYTSGTTGKPKGVMLEHLGVSNLINYTGPKFGIKPKSRVLQFASLSFDASVYEWMSTLSHGGTLCVVDSYIVSSGKLTDFMRDYCINIAMLPPALLAIIDEQNLPDLTTLVSGGDRLTDIVIKKWTPYVQLINAYGPTEITVACTMAECSNDGRSSIGKPIINTKCFVLNQNLQPVPIGVVGELYVAGFGLARGYLNNPLLTKERFVDLYFDGVELIRAYRTGDLVRWLSNGSLEYLGRIDDQLSVNGYRVEPGEIENVLNRYPGIENARVLIQEVNQINLLIGYYQVKIDMVIDQNRLKQYMSDQLPAYMLPKYYILVDNIPLSSNMKVDLKALPLPLINESDKVNFVLPRNHIENILFGIWSELLRNDHFGIFDDFFSCGGDSILSIQMINKARQRGLNINLQNLFRSPTIAQIAENIENSTNKLITLSEIKISSGDYPLTPIQHWFFEQKFAKQNHFNQAVMLDLRDDVRVEILEKSLNALLIYRQELGLKFIQKDGVWRQSYLGEAFPDLSFLIHDVTSYPDNEHESMITQFSSKVQENLDIETNHLFKAVIFKYYKGYKLLLVSHHLVTDAVSWRLILEDLKLIYNCYMQNRTVKLYNNRYNFGEWAEAINTYSNSESLLKELDYWSRHELNHINSLPYDYRDGANLVSHGSIIKERLSIDETKKLVKSIPQYYNCNIDTILLTALLLTFKDWTGEDRLLLNMEAHGREAIIDNLDINSTIGWFTSVYPLVLDFNGNSGLKEKILSIANLLDKVPHKGIGYGILRYLNKEVKHKIANIKSNVSFNYLGQFENTSIKDDLFSYSLISAGQNIGLNNQRIGELEFNLRIINNQLEIYLAYSSTQFKAQNMEYLIAQYVKNLKSIIYINKENSLPQAKNFDIDPILSIKESGEHAPLFLIHPIEGLSIPYLTIAPYIENRQIYAINNSRLSNPSTAYGSIEEMASDYLNKICTINSDGPYLLAGWSFGGIVAWEIAQQLTQIGKTVEIVTMIDSFAVNSLNPTNFAYRLAHAHKLYEEADIEEQKCLKLEVVNNLNLLQKYETSSYSGRVVILKAREIDSQSFRLSEDETDIYNGWKNWCIQEPIVEVIPGHHNALFDEPYLISTAVAINKYINQKELNNNLY